jgi:quinol monooxygenase YgiN
MDQLQINATFPNITAENLADFKTTVAECVAIVASEEGTLSYDMFLSVDETTGVLREVYASSDAVLAHMGNMGERLGRLIELGGGMEIEVFGEPSAALIEAAAAFDPTVFSHLGGK